MSKKIIIMSIWYLISIMSLSGQCPDRDLLWERITYFKGSTEDPTQKELEELLSYLDKLSDCPNKNDTTHVSLLHLIAYTYFQQADYLEAVHYRQQAIDIITANAGKPSIKVNSLPGEYYWLSVAYDSLDNITEKMKALDSCIAASIRLKYVDRSTLTAFDRRVQYFFDVGDYQRCIDYAQLWASLGQKYANDSPGFEHVVGEGAVYSSVGWQVKALLELKNFEAAEGLLKDKLGEYNKAGLKNYVAMIYGQMAGVQEQKSDYGKALSYFNLSLKYYQGIRDYFNCKQTTKDIGNLYFRSLGDRERALVFFKKALTYINTDESQNLKDASESLDIFANIADVYAEKGYYDLAHRYFQFAFDQVKPGINEIDILNSSPEEIKKIKKIHYLSGLIIDKGDAYRKQFEATRERELLIKAIGIYKVADQFLNKIKAEQTDVQSKLFWRSDSRRLYENAIEACYLQHSLGDAFYFFEKSRAVLLQDQLNEQHWSGQNDILRQTQLEKNILHLEKAMNSRDKKSSDYSDIQNEIFKSRQELAQLQDRIKENDPLYYQSFVDKTSISIKDVEQKVLKDHQALVELFAGDSAVYLLAVTGQRVYLEKVNKADFDRLSDSYRNFISNADLLNRRFGAFKVLSQQLYQIVFKNIELPTGRIIISPDGKYFPFEALVTNLRPLTYFLDDHAVTYTYSARYLLNDFPTGTAFNSYAFMGIAPVRYNNGLAALPGSDQSLHRMRNYFSNATSLAGPEASKNNFLKDYYKYKIIQLYTHATDSGYTGEPMIYFSDSALSLSDLFYERKPATNLIVLSACETAGGKLYNGEGVFSFNRQFAALGIPSSVSNLWKADDQSTYKITELFYKYLSKGLPLDVALQKAKKEFKSISSKERNLPYYWAASILIGRDDPIPLQKPFPWIWVGIIVIVLIFVFGGLKIMQRNRSTQLKKLASMS